MEIKDYLRALGDLVAPRFCIVCESRLGLDERQICDKCRSDIPYTYNWAMPHNPMADRYNECIQRQIETAMDAATSRFVADSDDEATRFVAGSDDEVLPDENLNEGVLPDVPEPYAYAAALFFYRSGSQYREITKALKYHSNLEAGRMFASSLAKYLVDSEQFADVDLVLPVPLHWTRRWSRGYNQAEIIAEEIVAAFQSEKGTSAGKMVLKSNRLLRRRRRTRTQTHLSIADKRQNVYRAFAINRREMDRLEAYLMPTHILLVDDVFTTGATLSECHRALREFFGPEVRISIATLACVGS